MSKKVKYNDKHACCTSTETWATSLAHEKSASWMNCVCAKVAQRRKLKLSYSVFEISNEVIDSLFSLFYRQKKI